LTPFPVCQLTLPAQAVPRMPPQAAVSNVPTKPEEEDRIAPVGTAYTPISLGPPKKLKNPFAALEQSQSQIQPSKPQTSPGGAKKLTWSERQALAKKQTEEEEQRSRQASFKPPVVASVRPAFTSSAPAFGRSVPVVSPVRNFGAPSVPTMTSTIPAPSARVRSTPVSSTF
jgi:hypothetical protein